jgi:hypothetical protein
MDIVISIFEAELSSAIINSFVSYTILSYEDGGMLAHFLCIPYHSYPEPGSLVLVDYLP